MEPVAQIYKKKYSISIMILCVLVNQPVWPISTETARQQLQSPDITKDTSANRRLQALHLDSLLNLGVSEYAPLQIDIDSKIAPHAQRLPDSLIAAKIRYNLFALETDKRIYSWHHLSSIIIFILSCSILLFGLVLSAFQFYSAYNRIKPSNDQPQSIDDSSSKPTIDLSLSITSGISIKSSFIGLAILAISIAFFYLYLVHVYPIVIK